LDSIRIDPKSRVVLDEKRIVNGQELLALQIVGANKGIAYKWFGYYYGGHSGSVQAVCYSLETAVDDNIDLFADFLNGLEISKTDVIAKPVGASIEAGIARFNGNMYLRFDPKKWKQMPAKEEGHYYFSYSLGDAYAVISPNPLPIPTDSFAEVALGSAKSTDRNGAIVAIEKKNVNGATVLFVKTATTFNKNPMIYCGYYYGGIHNSVQILTYTTKQLLPKYERDLMEFLNGFAVSNEQ
jgi:hypothetical protein